MSRKTLGEITSHGFIPYETSEFIITGNGATKNQIEKRGTCVIASLSGVQIGCTVPEGFRPKTKTIVSCTGALTSVTDVILTAEINPDGSVVFANANGTNSTGYIVEMSNVGWIIE